MKSGTRDRPEEAVKAAKRSEKRNPGNITDDRAAATKGQTEPTTGRFQQKTGQMKRDVLRD